MGESVLGILAVIVRQLAFSVSVAYDEPAGALSPFGWSLMNSVPHSKGRMTRLSFSIAKYRSRLCMYLLSME
ncbi:MAG: hypothetical protein ABI791_12445 [Acidobacteriota bacterium]